jgi:hypothetical protein
MKTVQDYLNDPRLLNDPGMAAALEPVREIHAARLMLQDETAHMTTAEKIEFHNNNAKAFLADLGLPPILVNLSGQGKLKPRTPVIQ